MDLDRYEKRLRAYYDDHKADLVSVPLGKSGRWEVSHYETEIGIELMRLMRDGRGPGLGRYTRLSCKGTGTFMTDTPAEMDDLKRQLIPWARGAVLVSGLGLGLTLKLLSRKFEGGQAKHPVTHITVLEKSPDVIKLVAPSYNWPQVRIIEADCFTWEPDRKFDTAWHDIWPDMCADYLPEMTKLRKRFARAMTGPRRQFCWAEHYMRRAA